MQQTSHQQAMLGMLDRAPMGWPHYWIFLLSTGGTMLGGVSVFTLGVALPLLIQSFALDAAMQGLLGAALLAGAVPGAAFGGPLADRFGRRWPAVAGLALMSIGCAITGLGSAAPDSILPLPASGPGVGLPLLVTGLTLAGAGLGLSHPALQTSALESVERRHAGAAAGVYSTSRYFGSIVGTSLLAGVLGPSRDPAGFATVFLMCVLAAALGTVVALALRDRPAART